MARTATVAACLLLGFAGLALTAAQNSFTRCARDDPNLNSCLRKAIQDVIRSLKDGNKDLGLSKLDPLTLEKVSLKSSDGKTLDLLNYDVNGLKDVVCENALFTMDGNTFQLSFDLLLPQFDAAGSYKMERFFLGSPKPNEGTFTFNLTAYRVKFVLKGTITKSKDGKEYATLSGISSSFNGGTNPKFHFSHQSTGRNRLWNREPQELIQSYKEAIDLIHPTLASAYGNILFQQIPLDELFPATETRPDHERLLVVSERCQGATCVSSEPYSYNFQVLSK